MVTGLGKILLIVGSIIIILGLIFIFSQYIPFLGKLPGDITIKKEGGSSFYFPIVTCIIISIALTIIINVIVRFISK